jgi:hypothetical protein
MLYKFTFDPVKFVNLHLKISLFNTIVLEVNIIK